MRVLLPNPSTRTHLHTGASADNFLPTQGRAARRACKVMRWYVRGPFERAPARPHTPSLCAPMPFRSCSWLTPRPYRTCTQGGQTLDLKLDELLRRGWWPTRWCARVPFQHALARSRTRSSCPPVPLHLCGQVTYRPVPITHLRAVNSLIHLPHGEMSRCQ